MPWRDSTDPYYVLVSEIMLQQTQVDRVRPKFEAFIQKFPTLADLAAAPQSEVLITWSGLGYNRRARYLHMAAKQIVAVHRGRVPGDQAALTALPGIGPNTAAAILAYAFNEPVVFIETNIRTVYLHHFFKDRDAIADAELLPYLKATLDHANPREWYWALMDYGAYLKRRGLGKITASKHYAKQSTFQGSSRQIRGKILNMLANGPLSLNTLRQQFPDPRLDSILEQLITEQLIQKANGQIGLVD